MSDTVGFVDMDNRKYSLVLPLVAVITPYMQAEATEKVFEVDYLNASLWSGGYLKDIKSRNSFLTVVVMMFQDSLRDHYDTVREEGKTNLLKTGADCQWQYYLTVYEVIVNELVKMAFNIKVKYDNVYYANRRADDIIECTSERTNLYKDIACYDASNWNYFFLINVLNQIKNGGALIDGKLIDNTYTKIIQNEKYKDYGAELKRAQKDIKIYFEELQLYDYLNKVRNLIFYDKMKLLFPCDCDKQKVKELRKNCDIFKNYNLYIYKRKGASQYGGFIDLFITKNIKKAISNELAAGIKYTWSISDGKIRKDLLCREITCEEARQIRDQAANNKKDAKCEPTNIMNLNQIKVLAKAIDSAIQTETGMVYKDGFYYEIWNILKKAQHDMLTREDKALLTFFDLYATTQQLYDPGSYNNWYINIPVTNKTFTDIVRKINNIILHKEDFNSEHPILKEFYKAFK